jgi:hypothetical protein
MTVASGRGTFPDDLIETIVLAENFIENCLGVVPNVPVEMNIDTTIL